MVNVSVSGTRMISPHLSPAYETLTEDELNSVPATEDVQEES